MTNFKRWELLGACVLLGIGVVLGCLIFPPGIFKGDEGHHLDQVAAYLHGVFKSPAASGLTMLPGYHAVLAVLAKLLGVQSSTALRYISLAISLPALLVFYCMARELRQRAPLLLVMLFFFSPLFYVYFFSIYTDIFSLLLVLTAVYLTIRNKIAGSAGVMLLAILVRQDNAIWAALCLLLMLSNGHFTMPTTVSWGSVRESVSSAFKQGYPLVFIILGFLVFVVLNRGVAIGDASMHSLGRLYITQVFIFLFVVFVLLAPLHIANLKSIAALLRARPQLIVLGALLFILFKTTFWVDHLYNTIDGFVHNNFLIWLRRSELNQFLAFVGMYWALLSLVVTPMHQPRFYWLYPVTIMAILPHGLIEQRYFMVPVALLMLFMRLRFVRLHYILLAQYILSSWFLCINIYHNKILF